MFNDSQKSDLGLISAETFVSWVIGVITYLALAASEQWQFYSRDIYALHPAQTVALTTK